MGSRGRTCATALLLAAAAGAASCTRIGYGDREAAQDGLSPQDGTPDHPRPAEGLSPASDCRGCGSDAIAPVQLLWNTFLGGSGGEYGKSIQVEAGGSVLVCGMSSVTWGKPVEPFKAGNWDAFVARLDANGDLVWNTFLGAADWGGDRCLVAASDKTGAITVVGCSDRSWGAPLRPFSGPETSQVFDAFVARLGSDGGLLWNTFLGGLGVDTGTQLAVDGSGNIYVAGTSSKGWSAPFTLRPYSGQNELFVAKLQPNGTLAWNTFLGSAAGQDQHSRDTGVRIGVDASGSVHVVGTSSATWGTPQRPFGGGTDAFVARLSPDGLLLWSTFLGGGADDDGRSLAFDATGNLLVAGHSAGSWGTPVSAFAGGGLDGFVAKLDGGGKLVWNAFVGGSALDAGDTITTDQARNVYVGGFSRGSWGAPRRPFQGGLSDGFVAKLDSSGALRWNAFLGSPGGPGPDDDYACAVALDASGNVFLAGDSDAAWGDPRRPYTGAHDAFAAKLDNPP